MVCPCSKRTDPRQAGSQQAPAPPPEAQSGHPPRGYRWNGPQGRAAPAAPAEPTPSE